MIRSLKLVIDASAGVELIAETTRGRALRSLLPADAVPWTPETFFVEVGSVLRRWDLIAILTPDQIAAALAPARFLAAASRSGALLVRARPASVCRALS
jgi:predicted nucleic acid-binding protein